jgi:hypothetical protein
MSGGVEGESPRVELTNQQTNQQEAKPQQRSPESQQLPSVWDVLERKARASDEFLLGRMSGAEYDRERDKVNRLKVEIDEKGTDRDKHIFALLLTGCGFCNCL